MIYPIIFIKLDYSVTNCGRNKSDPFIQSCSKIYGQIIWL